MADAEAAARVADAVRARLRAVPFETAIALIQSPAAVQAKDANGAYNPNDGTRYPEVLFGKLDGEVGIYDTASNRRQWYDSRNRVMPNTDKFFEIDLIRQPAVSPPSSTQRRRRWSTPCACAGRPSSRLRLGRRCNLPRTPAGR